MRLQGSGSLFLNTKQVLSIYPNPTKNILQIAILNSISENVTIKIYDVFGKLVLSKEKADIFSQLEIGTLAKGIYFIEAESGSEKLSDKFIIE